MLCLRNLWLTQGHKDFLFFLLKFLRGLALTFRTLVCIGLIFVYGVRERSKFIFVHGDISYSSTCIIAFVCCLLSPPLLLPGGEQHCPPAAASALTSLSLQFTRPTDYLDCTTLDSSFLEEELDWLAHLGSEDNLWSSHVCLGVEFTWCDFGCQGPSLCGWGFSERRLGVSWANTPKVSLQGHYLIFSTLDPLWTRFTLQFRLTGQIPQMCFCLTCV